MAAGDRVVRLTNEFLVFCPFAARVPLELCILPRRHASHFDLEPYSFGRAARGSHPVKPCPTGKLQQRHGI